MAIAVATDRLHPLPLLAWVLTLPVCVALGASLFAMVFVMGLFVAMGFFFVLRMLGVH